MRHWLQRANPPVRKENIMAVIKRPARLIAAFAALLGSIIVGLSLTTPANAASSDGYRIVVEKACFLKYGGQEALMGAGYQNIADANSWYCKRKVGDTTGLGFSASTDKSASFEASVGSDWTIIGDVDMQLYCDSEYPGTQAVVTDSTLSPGAFNWRCEEVA